MGVTARCGRAWLLLGEGFGGRLVGGPGASRLVDASYQAEATEPYPPKSALGGSMQRILQAGLIVLALVPLSGAQAQDDEIEVETFRLSGFDFERSRLHNHRWESTSSRNTDQNTSTCYLQFFTDDMVSIVLTDTYYYDKQGYIRGVDHHDRPPLS